MVACQHDALCSHNLCLRREKVMKQWRRMPRIMARVSLALAVLSGSPRWAKRRGKHAVPSLVVLTAFWLLPFTPQAIVPAAASGCQLHSAKGDIQHVIFLIFDNVHFLRDNPNVPSDLGQMPNLLNFIRSDGTFLTNDHTVLISHTANGILTNLTGVYSDRHGQAVANSYRYFKTDGSTASSSSFKYWTDLVDDTGTVPADPLPNMVNGDSGAPLTTPAPWVPFTRAGC